MSLSLFITTQVEIFRFSLNALLWSVYFWFEIRNRGGTLSAWDLGFLLRINLGHIDRELSWDKLWLLPRNSWFIEFFQIVFIIFIFVQATLLFSIWKWISVSHRRGWIIDFIFVPKFKFVLIFHQMLCNIRLMRHNSSFRSNRALRMRWIWDSNNAFIERRVTLV